MKKVLLTGFPVGNDLELLNGYICLSRLQRYTHRTVPTMEENTKPDKVGNGHSGILHLIVNDVNTF